MAEYIDRQELFKNLNKFALEHYNAMINKLIIEQPTADVVEVVRCKDCKLSSELKTASRYDLYCNGYDVYYCEKEQKIVCGTHFCSYGLPKEGDGEK